MLAKSLNKISQVSVSRNWLDGPLNRILFDVYSFSLFAEKLFCKFAFPKRPLSLFGTVDRTMGRSQQSKRYHLSWTSTLR